MTLLEILIVLAIIAGIVTLGAMNLRTPKSDVRSDIRKLLILSKRLNQQAQLEGKIYRMAFSFDKENASYWVETSDKDTVAKAVKDTFADDEEESDFKMATHFTEERNSLPKGFYFAKLVLIEQALFFDNGIAYIHFFPQGMADAAALQITNIEESLAWTMIVNPLTGSSELVDGLYDEKQLRRD